MLRVGALTCLVACVGAELSTPLAVGARHVTSGAQALDAGERSTSLWQFDASLVSHLFLYLGREACAEHVCARIRVYLCAR